MKQAGVQLGCRIAVLLWASLWMLAIPLFHVHPAVNHRHGGAVHAYGVTVHTVLSSDLEGEFDDHHHADTSQGRGSCVSLFDHHSHALDQHPEIEFSLLNDSSERKAFKPLFVPVFAADIRLDSHLERQFRTDVPSIPVRASTIFVRHLQSRAPPILFS